MSADAKGETEKWVVLNSKGTRINPKPLSESEATDLAKQKVEEAVSSNRSEVFTTKQILEG